MFVSWFFPSKRKGFPSKFCVLVCNCYFGLLIFVIILFGTQQVFQLAFAPIMNIKQDKVVFRQNEEKLSKVLDIYEKRLGSWLVMNFIWLIFHTCPTLSTWSVTLIRAIHSFWGKMWGDGGTRYRAETHGRRWLICRRVLRKFGWHFWNKLLQFGEFIFFPFFA